MSRLGSSAAAPQRTSTATLCALPWRATHPRFLPSPSPRPHPGTPARGGRPRRRPACPPLPALLRVCRRRRPTGYPPGRVKGSRAARGWLLLAALLHRCSPRCSQASSTTLLPPPHPTSGLGFRPAARTSRTRRARSGVGSEMKPVDTSTTSKPCKQGAGKGQDQGQQLGGRLAGGSCTPHGQPGDSRRRYRRRPLKLASSRHSRRYACTAPRPCRQAGVGVRCLQSAAAPAPHPAAAQPCPTCATSAAAQPASARARSTLRSIRRGRGRARRPAARAARGAP